MVFFSEIGTEIVAGQAARQLFKIPDAAKKFVVQSKERLTDGSLGIFIFGPQGTGKTTLLGILSGKKEINDIPTEYLSSSKNEHLSSKNNIYFKVFAGPGQEALQNIHWPDLYTKMNGYKRVICIFCTSYGCHALFEEGMSSIEKGTVNISDDLMIGEYLENKRIEESKLFKGFCEKLKAIPGSLGLLLLVTKQDLWWPDRLAVQKHYSRGEFAKSMKGLREAKKAVGLVTDAQSVSLSLQNLLTSDREMLVPTAAGYDQLLQRANFELFRNKLAEMAAMLTGK